MKRLSIYFTIICLVISLAMPIGASGEAGSIGQIYGNELTTDDFFYSDLENEWLHFLNQDPGSYLYYSFDKTGKVVPNDSDDGFATNREIHLLDTKEMVLAKYGEADVLPYSISTDILYSAMKGAGDSNRDILQSCIDYVVYTLEDTAQIIFFFDADNELIVVAYIYAIVYEDSISSLYMELSKGSKGDEVVKLQNRLKELGFYTISVDGDYGNGTVKAVERFQQFSGLEITGIASIEMQAKLFSNEAQGILNPDNRNRFIAKGKELFPFMSLAFENGYSIDNPTRTGEVVFATASNDVNDYPICYFVESQKVYSVSVIERKQGDIKKDGYIDCAVAMAKSLNYKAVDEEVREAVQLAIANPGIGAMNMANDMQFIYEANEGMLTISY